MLRLLVILALWLVAFTAPAKTAVTFNMSGYPSGNRTVRLVVWNTPTNQTFLVTRDGRPAATIRGNGLPQYAFTLAGQPTGPHVYRAFASGSVSNTVTVTVN